MKANQAKLAALALVMGLVASNAAMAAETPHTELGEYVVTAQRMNTLELDTPAATTVLTAQDLKNTGGGYII